MFMLTAHDTSEDFDDDPASLLPLVDWLEASARGSSPFPLDPFEGVGIELSDGGRSFRSVSWGAAADIADGCRHLHERLSAGQIGLFRSSYLGSPVYLWFQPSEGTVRCGRAPMSPPSTAFPYPDSPSSSTPDQIEALYAWIYNHVGAGDPQAIRLPRETLLGELDTAHRAASDAVARLHVHAPSDPPTAVRSTSPRPAEQRPITLRLGPPTVHRIELIRGLRALTLADYEPTKEWVIQLEKGATIEVTPHSPQALDDFRDQSSAWGLQVVP